MVTAMGSHFSSKTHASIHPSIQQKRDLLLYRQGPPPKIWKTSYLTKWNNVPVILFSTHQPETLAAFTGYSLSEIVPCLSDLHKACLDASHRPQQAIREKYKLSK